MITWPDLIWVLLAVALLVVLIALLGWRARRKNAQTDANRARQRDRYENYKELEAWLYPKMTDDLTKADKQTTPYVKAFIEIVQQSGTVDELRPIVEVYRYRSGFNPEWIGE